VLLRFCVLALGSLLIGVGVALACAFVLKRLEALGPHQAAAAPSTASVSSAGGAAAPAAAGRDSSTSFEIAVVVMGSYFSYLLAETAGMSGIVALFFSGICHSHYSYYSVNTAAQVTGVLLPAQLPAQLRCRRRQAGTAGWQPQLAAAGFGSPTAFCPSPPPQPYPQVTLRHFFEFASFLCEMFVFAYLGLQVATMQHAFDFGLFFSGIPLAVLSRAANIFLCSRLINTWRAHKLPVNLQKMLLAVGLRGAVAYGLGGCGAAGGRQRLGGNGSGTRAVCRQAVRLSDLLWPLSNLPRPPPAGLALPAVCSHQPAAGGPAGADGRARDRNSHPADCGGHHAGAGLCHGASAAPL
jgi:hypothetical protein